MVARSMGTSRPGVNWAKLISPLVYALAFIPTLILNIGAVVGVSYLLSLVWPGWDMQSNVGVIAWLAGALLASLFIFGVLFGGVGWLLLRWERVSRPKLVDHLRRCALLYAALLLLGSLSFYLLFTLPPPPEGDAPGGIFAVLALMCIAYSIALDAGVLLLKRRRFSRTDPGGAT